MENVLISCGRNQWQQRLIIVRYFTVLHQILCLGCAQHLMLTVLKHNYIYIQQENLYLLISICLRLYLII